MASEFKGWVVDVTETKVIIRCGSTTYSYDKDDVQNINIFDFVHVKDGNLAVLTRSRIPAFKHDFRTPMLIALCREQLIRSARLLLEADSVTQVFPPVLLASQLPGEDPALNVGDSVLSQTSQGHLEQWVPIVGDCYCLGRSFRRVTQATNRHVSEFLHLEVEWVGVLTLDELTSRVRSFIINLVTNFRSLAHSYLTELGVDSDIDLSCPILDYTPECETPTRLSLILNPPRSANSFDLKPGMAVDVVVPVMGEIMGCGIREYDVDSLAHAILASGKTLDEYSEYLSLRAMGHGRTAGFGLGVDRLLAWLLNKSDIRDIL